MHSRGKSITLMLMKSRRWHIVLTLVAFAASSALGVFGPLLAPPVRAAGAADDYVWYYPVGDAQYLKALGQAITDGDEHDPAFEKTIVYTKGGAFKDKPFPLAYNGDRSDCAQADAFPQTGCNGDYGGQDKNLFVYSATYECSNGNLAPDKSKGYYSVDFNVSMNLHKSLGKTFFNENTIRLQNMTIQTLVHHLPTSSTKPAQEVNVQPSDLPANCRPSLVNAGFHTGKTRGANVNLNIKNYQRHPKELAAAWPGLDGSSNGTDTTAGGGGSASGGDLIANTQCEDGAVTLGWILCPIINLANKGVRTLVDEVIIPELQMRPLETNGNLYQVHSNIKSLANVLFVLIFLVIIFANLNPLDMNVEAYTIKNSMPKLIISAVLVQFSYVICAALVDLGNIMGVGISGLVNVTINSGTATAGSNSTFTILGGVLAGGLGIATVAAIGVPTLLVAAVSGIFSAIAVVFTLIARREVIYFMVIVSPLAFAAIVLPSTEKMFKKWLETFIKLQLMYALIIMILSAATIGVAITKDGASKIEGLLASIMVIVAFFAIPSTFKWAGGALSKATGIIDKGRGGITGKFKGSEAMESLRGRRATRKKDARIGALDKGGFKGWKAAVQTQGTLMGTMSPGRPKLGLKVKKKEGGKWFKPSDYTAKVNPKGPTLTNNKKSRTLQRQRQQIRDQAFAEAKKTRAGDVAKIPILELEKWARSGEIDPKSEYAGLLGEAKTSAAAHAAVASRLAAKNLFTEDMFGRLASDESGLDESDRVRVFDDIQTGEAASSLQGTMPALLVAPQKAFKERTNAAGEQVDSKYRTKAQFESKPENAGKRWVQGYQIDSEVLATTGAPGQLQALAEGTSAQKMNDRVKGLDSLIDADINGAGISQVPESTIENLADDRVAINMTDGTRKKIYDTLKRHLDPANRDDLSVETRAHMEKLFDAAKRTMDKDGKLLPKRSGGAGGSGGGGQDEDVITGDDLDDSQATP